DPLWQGQSGGHQERRPIDAVEAHNLFADHVHSGPEFFVFTGVGLTVSQCSNVIGERIEPDINHMLGIVRDRDAPRKGAAADRKIAQPATNKRKYLVPPSLWADEIRMFRKEGDQFVLEGRKLEVIILFVNRFRGTAAIRARSA